jgi:hypothetical protein
MQFASRTTAGGRAGTDSLPSVMQFCAADRRPRQRTATQRSGPYVRCYAGTTFWLRWKALSGS